MHVKKKISTSSVIDLSNCSDFRGCIEIAPKVFRYNSAMGIMEVIECHIYPQELVDEAIKNCQRIVSIGIREAQSGTIPLLCS